MTGDRTDNREQDREQGIGQRTRNWTENTLGREQGMDREQRIGLRTEYNTEGKKKENKWNKALPVPIIDVA